MLLTRYRLLWLSYLTMSDSAITPRTSSPSITGRWCTLLWSMVSMASKMKERALMVISPSDMMSLIGVSEARAWVTARVRRSRSVMMPCNFGRSPLSSINSSADTPLSVMILAASCRRTVVGAETGSRDIRRVTLAVISSLDFSLRETAERSRLRSSISTKSAKFSSVSHRC